MSNNASWLAWQGFCEFAREPIEDERVEGDDADGLLFQTGVYDWGDGHGPSFQWSLTRQFTLYDGPDYDHMEQLELVLHYAPSPALEALPRSELWSFGLSLDEWMERVQAFSAFALATDHELTPSRAELRQGEV